jgi:gamma-glutamyltranspeptidase/glutathione hydrolase
MLTRRRMLRLTGQTVLSAALFPRPLFAAEPKPPTSGAIAGEATAARVGRQILADGGNAADAVVAAALVACVVSPHNCGVGGYGGHAVFAFDGGRKVGAIDFNGPAPAAARPDMFALDEKGAVRDRANEHGWRAAGVPGILAGLQFALERFGTRSFREALGPAIGFARDGFPLTQGVASGIARSAAEFRKDPASARLWLKDGEPPAVGETHRNPDLAQLLETLAAANSVEPFYRGDLARRIAAAFQQHGGLLTVKDLADYRAREVAPLSLAWRNYTLLTAPLTAGGLTVLEVIRVLQALKWTALPPGPARTHARLEALRLAWHDRLALLGDPDHVKAPVAKLLSAERARELAARVEQAVKARKAVPPPKTEPRAQRGTVHLSCVDRHGNLAALTLTHGNAFGARVTVAGLGLTLGHGLSRFEPRPGHPNSVGPGKRPLHNMCPTIVLRDGQPVLALGGAGGRKIPNSVFDVLTQFVGLEASLDDALVAPRWHTEGGLDLTLEKTWPETEQEFFKAAGYTLKPGTGAILSAALFDPKTGETRAAAR